MQYCSIYPYWSIYQYFYLQLRSDKTDYSQAIFESKLERAIAKACNADKGALKVINCQNVKKITLWKKWESLIS